mmetsp:Transcript_62166/g.69585  ORF Transcript_62166/g.69585 Transcript_62166/m.69585 type:complete len:207 (+) Transcript_62166:69-689(+)
MCFKVCLYICCPCLLCCPSLSSEQEKVKKVSAAKKASQHIEPSPTLSTVVSGDHNDTVITNQELQDYENLQHIAQVRKIRVTIRKGTQAGIAAGLSVTAGTIAFGPVGAVAGGVVGTAMASKIAKNVVSLAEILEATPIPKRHLVITACNDAFREEFLDTVLESPELKLIFGGQSIFGVVRYMVDRNLIASEKLETLDWILESKII